MLLLHMQEIVFVDSQESLLSSRGGGGGRHTGTRLTAAWISRSPSVSTQLDVPGGERPRLRM